MNITPNNKSHSKLERDFADYLESIGYLTESAPYHDTMRQDIVRLIQNNYSPTGLYLRGRADRIAVNKNGDIFEWEAKTHASTQYHDMTTEALPLAHHINKQRLGVRCLYVYRDEHISLDCGFWVDQLPPIKVIMIPPRWTQEQSRWFSGIFKSFFGGIDIAYTRANKGSGDPFIIIAEEIARRLPHWKTLVTATQPAGATPA